MLVHYGQEEKNLLFPGIRFMALICGVLAAVIMFGINWQKQHA
jgi:type IV secretory pathway TrbD component